MVSRLDEAVKTVVDALKATGVYKNTICWFSADNGAPNSGGFNFPLKVRNVVSRRHHRAPYRLLLGTRSKLPMSIWAES